MKHIFKVEIEVGSAAPNYKILAELLEGVIVDHFTYCQGVYVNRKEPKRKKK